MDKLLGRYIVMVRDRGQDEARRLPKIYPSHEAAICVKHNLVATGRYASVFARLADDNEVDLSEE